MSFTPLPVKGPVDEDALRARIARGLRMITVPFPYLSGLAAATRVTLDSRLPTMGVFASGRMIANPQFVARLNDSDLSFVLAHEMLHLALRTHDRLRGSDPLEFNYAHDYIINDMLRVAMGRTTIPADGLDMAGARHRSAEDIVLEMRRNSGGSTRTRVWEGHVVTVRGRFGEGGRGDDDAGDVLSERLEHTLFPDDMTDPAREAEATRELAARALGLAKAIGARGAGRGSEAGGQQQVVDALRGLYRTPWELALQRWLESVAPGERTFTRASRRGAQRVDIVMPGRRREGWILNVVLDTSGSMTDVIARALGAIADFCDAVAIEQVRVLQCDAQVTADDLVSPLDLVRMSVTGYGGSDMTPALDYLAADPQVRAVLVLTDGDVTYPAAAPPFDVLWVLTPEAALARFAPPFGRVVQMQPS
jgi:predicted metal-dependent peptidase